MFTRDGATTQISAQNLLLNILRCAEELNPAKDAIAYWQAINRTMLGFDNRIRDLWEIEKIATSESIKLAKEEALTILAKEREVIMRMSRDEAIGFLIKGRNIDGRERVIRALSDNGIFTLA
jgi:type II restriction enzyme